MWFRGYGSKVFSSATCLCGHVQHELSTPFYFLTLNLYLFLEKERTHHFGEESVLSFHGGNLIKITVIMIILPTMWWGLGRISSESLSQRDTEYWPQVVVAGVSLNTLVPAFLCSGQRKDKEDISLVKGENSLKGEELSWNIKVLAIGSRARGCVSSHKWDIYTPFLPRLRCHLERV